MAAGSRETRDRLAAQPERRHPVGDALLDIGDNRNDRVAQLVKRCSPGLIEGRQVLVDLTLGHGWILNVGTRGVKLVEGKSRCRDRARPRRGEPRGRLRWSVAAREDRSPG